MGTADGRVVGTVKVVDHGDAAERWNVVLLAEGYREEELAGFAEEARRFSDRLLATPPFGELSTTPAAASTPTATGIPRSSRASPTSRSTPTARRSSGRV